MPFNRPSYRLRWTMVKRFHDFMCVHYPKGKEIFQDQGKFKKPIYIQTQIGVNSEIFYPSEKSKTIKRQELSIPRDVFVFCYVARIHEEKGIFDILEAFKHIDFDFKLLILGNGKDSKKVKEKIVNFKLENKVKLLGYVENETEVAEYLNASDCLLHVPKTTKTWVDTFPLAVVQGMACSIAIIGSDSGAIPYQLGENGIIVKEHNPYEIRKVLMKLLERKIKAADYGSKLLERATNCFEIEHLNRLLLDTVKDQLNNRNSIIHDQTELYEKN